MARGVTDDRDFYEDDFQRALVAELLLWETLVGGFTFSHIPNEGLGRSAAATAELVRQGLRAGEADLIFYLAGGRLMPVELKRRKGKGRRSEDQKKRHSLLDSLGFKVYTVQPESISAGIAEVLSLLRNAGVRIPENTDGGYHAGTQDTAADCPRR